MLYTGDANRKESVRKRRGPDGARHTDVHMHRYAYVHICPRLPFMFTSEAAKVGGNLERIQQKPGEEGGSRGQRSMRRNHHTSQETREFPSLMSPCQILDFSPWPRNWFFSALTRFTPDLLLSRG